MIPSSLLFYLGIDKELSEMKHHVLFFDKDFSQYTHEIYTSPKWSTRKILFNICRENNPGIYFVSNRQELKRKWFIKRKHWE